MNITKISKLSAAILAFCAFSIPATQVYAGAESFDDESNAKMARVKAKTKRIKKSSASTARSTAKSRTDSSSSDGMNAECGSINIGNTVNQSPVGVRNQETIVIIDGDVINANNECKK